MSGESAQDIEVSITAPNRSFHATVIASDVSWQDRPGGALPSEQPRRPIWSSAFGDSIDTVDTMDSEMSGDPMVNSTTSLSQDSLYDGYAVEFISSSKDTTAGLSMMNGGVSTGAGVVSSTTTEGAEAASAAFTATTTASDAVSTSIEMRPVGFAETDRGSISCEMITPKPVLLGNGHVVPSGEPATVTSSQQTTVTTTSSATTTVTSGSTVTSSSGDSSAVTTHTQQAPGSTFQMTAMESHEEHAEAPEHPRDRAMSLHERSLLAHDLHALASTMDTIKDEDEVHVGSSSPEEKEVKEEKREEESYTTDRRVSLSDVPISATTYVAPSQPTIFEAAETAAAAVAAAAEAAPEASEPSPYLKKLLDAQEATRQLMALLGESTQMLGALPTAKKDDDQEKEKEQSAADAAPVAGAAAPAAAEAASATSFTSQSSSSMTTFSSSSSSSTAAAAAASETSTTDSQATTVPPVTSTEIPVSMWQQPEAAADAAAAAPPATPTAAVPASPALEISSRPIDVTFDAEGKAAAPPPPFSLTPAADPASPISRGPASPAPATPTTAAAPTSTEIPVSVWPQQQEEEKKAETPAATEIPVTVWTPETGEAAKATDAAPAAPATTTEIPVTVWAPQTEQTTGETSQTPAAAAPESAAPAEETQNATICNALESLAANMTTVTTRNEESSSSSTTTTTAVDTASAPAGVTSDVPVTLGTPVLLEPSVSPKVSISEEPSSVDSAPSTPTPASLLHDSTVASLSVGLPTPRPTPEPDQERFVTNAEQSEATMTKSSFSLSATTTTSSSSTETAAASTDYVLPTTSVVLQAEDSVASTPAAAPAPTLTPAAVDVPVDIVRHLDDPAAWHSTSAGADVADGATAVPIAVSVEARGPPPLAREAPPAVEEEPARGPPPLAKESEEHHELSRSVMVERRVLSPDSALHSEKQQQQATTAAPTLQEPAAPVAATEPASAPTAQTEPAPAVTSTEIPVSVWPEQQAPAAETAPAPAQPDSAAATAGSTEIPVTVVQQPEQQATAADTASTPSQPEAAAPSSGSTEIRVTVVKEESTEQAKETTSAGSTEIPVTVVQQSQEESKPAEPTPTPASDAPLSVVLQPSLTQQQQSDAAKDASSVDIPVTVVKEEPTEPAKEQPSAPAAAEEAPAAVQQAPVLACELQQQPTGEQPVASAAQQEQQAAASAAPAADAAAPTTTSPTTAHAPMSLESTFQITPSEEEFAEAPAMARDRAMSIHERSLLAHEPSGFQPGLEPLPENINDDGEVHVASAIDRRRASLAPGELGEAPTSTFQVPSTSCLFTVDEAREESEATEAAPASTASPSGESTTTMASSTADAVIDVTAPETPVEAAKPPAQQSGGVKWLTESESSPDSPAQTTVVAAAPPEQQSESAQDTPAQESTVAAPSADASVPVSSVPATPVTVDAPPPTPKTPSGVSWITEPAGTTATTEPAQAPSGTTESVQAPPQTPKSPAAPATTWVTEPAATTAPTEPAAQAPPQTPKTPTGVTWVTEPAISESAAAAPQSPAAPATTWVTEPAPTGATDTSAPPQTPKTPTGVTWISEPAIPATPTSPALEISSRPLDITIDGGSVPTAVASADQSAAPPTPKTPSGVSWITEPATSGAPDVAAAAAPAATAAAPSVINITAPPSDSGDKAGAAAPPLTPTSPGIKWASDSERVGGNVVADGAAPPPAAESTFVVNAPWEGADQAPPKTPDADGVTWITEEPAVAAAPRPPLTRSESTRSERDPSTATDITVREATPQRRSLVPSASVEEENLTNGVTQEALGTKVRKLSWADQQPSQAEDSFSAAIDDYEKKLNETTAQTKELVDLLCQTGNQITENSMKMSDVFSDAVQAGVRSMLDQERRDRAAAALSPIAENGENISRSPPPQLVGGALPPNVESVIVSSPELKYVTGSLVLDNANILVTDGEAGLFLFTLDSTVVKHISNAAWKHPGSPVIFKDRLKSYILILMDCKDEEDGSWVRHIVKFSENLDYIEKVECPKWIRERTIISDRLALNRYENIYYCANGEIFSGLYELAPTGKWTELLYRQSESFIDMLAFAIIGPIQQILIVEGRRDHVLLCSIRESECVEARRMAICERPGALARDESGRLFVMNRAQAAVQIVDTRVWAACRNMALVDKFVPHFSAAFGMLVIPQKRAVKVHKYSFEWDD